MTENSVFETGVSPEAIEIPVSLTLQHPAQVRSGYSIADTCQLVRSIISAGGLRSDLLPIVRKGEGFYIVMVGHRRILAHTIVRMLTQASNEPTDEDIEMMVTGAFSPFYDGTPELDELVDIEWSAYLAEWNDSLRGLKVPVRLFEGDPVAEGLLVISDNFNRRDADPRGEIDSFQYAVNSLNISPETIAARIGRSSSYVTRRLAAGAFNFQYPELSEFYADLPHYFSFCQAFVRLTTAEAQQAVVLALTELAETMEEDRTKLLQNLAVNLHKLENFTDIQLSIEGQVGSRSNTIEVVLKAWEAAALDIRLQAALQYLIWGRDFSSLVSNNYSAHQFIAALQVVPADKNGSIPGWPELMLKYTPDKRCKNCVMWEFQPTTFLERDFPLRCRDVADRDPETVCLQYSSDPATITTNRIVIPDKREYGTLTGIPAMEENWKDSLRYQQEHTNTELEVYEDVSAVQEAHDLLSSVEEEVEISLGNNQEAGSHIDKQRGDIQEFMLTHVGYSGVNHPMATRCADCNFGFPQDTGSPIRCAWSDRLRFVRFYQLESVGEDESLVIPICRQHSPKEANRTLIPPTKRKKSELPDWTREPMRMMIHAFANRAAERTNVDIGFPFEQFTGRPQVKSAKYDEDYLGWLAGKLPEASNEEMFWILCMAFGEWYRIHVRSSYNGATGFYYPREAPQLGILPFKVGKYDPTVKGVDKSKFLTVDISQIQGV